MNRKKILEHVAAEKYNLTLKINELTNHEIKCVQ